MSAVALPELPREKEFEEYVAAVLQTCGYFVERNITEREAAEVLELDVIATRYHSQRNESPELFLIEAKSGEWGFPDIFKIKGWMVYLNIPNGKLVVQRPKDKIDFHKAIAERLGIQLLVIEDFEKNNELLEEVRCAELDTADISIWRFSCWLERKLKERLKQQKKSMRARRFIEMENYYFEINDRLFFIENIISRLDRLYGLFHEYANISAKSANEMIGCDYNEDIDKIPRVLYERTYYECNYNEIQMAAFIEHKSRLAVLKCAVDYILYRRAEDENRIEDIKILGNISLTSTFPSSLRRAIGILENHEYLYKYPEFWQWFLWVFGGFILTDRVEKEYELLSSKTGLPINEIENALSIYDELFPTEGGWFRSLGPNSSILLLKNFSVPFMGIGAFYRRCIYSTEQNLEDLGLGGAYTIMDLAKWNNMAYAILSG